MTTPVPPLRPSAFVARLPMTACSECGTPRLLTAPHPHAAHEHERICAPCDRERYRLEQLAERERVGWAWPDHPPAPEAFG